MSKTIADLIIDYKFDISMLREHSYGETEDDYIRSEGKADRLEEVVQDLERIVEAQNTKEIRVIQMDSEGGRFVREFEYSQGQASWTSVTKPEEAIDLNTTRHNESLVERAMTTRGGKVKTFTVTVTEKV